MIRLEQCHLYFHRNSINEVHALNDVTLHLKPGDFTTVIGSNGAGKSTLLNCMAGSFYPQKGTLTIQDTDVTRWPEYKRARYISRVFQDPLLGTCPSATIEQNMALAYKRGQRRGLGWGVKKRDRLFFREQLSHLDLGLENRLLDKVGLLSGGQRQALTMLMATMVRPSVLLLDEHIAALDPKTAGQILQLTNAIVRSQQLTTLMVTHNMHHALEMGNRLIMMHQGRVIVDVEGEEKLRLSVEDLLNRFYSVQEEKLALDSMLLS